jgi:hypothetical protein
MYIMFDKSGVIPQLIFLHFVGSATYRSTICRFPGFLQCVLLHTTWDQCYDFKTIIAIKIGSFVQTTATFR